MTTLFDDPEKLNELKIQMEVKKRLSELLPVKIKEAFNDPYQLQNLIMSRDKEIELLKPKAEAFIKLLDTMGEINCKQAHTLVKLNYITPAGKIDPIGSTYFIRLLEIDDIIYPVDNGHALYASHKKYGRTYPSIKNGRYFQSVIFNTDGAHYIVEKYLNDIRIFYSKNNKLYIKEDK